ncbi:Rv1733c family protein [Streptomyces sp. CA-249302]|uniref:Rv1733c family protein n=1 Tax=Streptomyces sp. CA-249302 TaxID=3240058 RepID=UPI003D89E293
MRKGRPTKRWLWRWRANPLRRRDDVLEAWLVLAVWAVVALGGTVAGVITARTADGVFAEQRAERTPVNAVLLSDAPRAAASGYRSLVTVRWTLPDGTTRTDTTLVEPGKRAGSHTVIWTDAQGDPTTEPPSPASAAVEAAFLGASAGLGVTGLVAAGGAAVRWRLNRRRVDQWGREWATVGPQWGHKTS